MTHYLSIKHNILGGINVPRHVWTEIEHFFENRGIQFRVEDIADGVILFYDLYIPEIIDLLKSYFEVYSPEKLPDSYYVIYDSYSDSVSYVDMSVPQARQFFSELQKSTFLPDLNPKIIHVSHEKKVIQ